jgi:thiol-disulfide isomerase/thioredoxin
MYSNYDRAYEQNPVTEEIKKTPRASYDLKDAEDMSRLSKLFPVVVVDAWATWCAPCEKAGLLFEKLANEFASLHDAKRVVFVKDNIGREEPPHRDHVTAVPTFFIHVRGRPEPFVVHGADMPRLREILGSIFQ